MVGNLDEFEILSQRTDVSEPQYMLALINEVRQRTLTIQACTQILNESIIPSLNLDGDAGEDVNEMMHNIGASAELIIEALNIALVHAAKATDQYIGDAE